MLDIPWLALIEATVCYLSLYQHQNNHVYRICTKVTFSITWLRHQMETFSALLFVMGIHWTPPPPPHTHTHTHTQRPVTRNFGDFFDLCLNKRLSKQSTRRWFETPSRLFWSHCNENGISIGSMEHDMYPWNIRVWHNRNRMPLFYNNTLINVHVFILWVINTKPVIYWYG